MAAKFTPKIRKPKPNMVPKVGTDGMGGDMADMMEDTVEVKAYKRKKAVGKVAAILNKTVKPKY